MPVTLRSARLDDATAIARVHIASWQTAYRGIFPDAYLDGMTDGYSKRRARWEHGLQHPESAGTTTFVVEDVGEGVVGFATAGSARKPELGFAGELHAIYLLAGHRRGGLGRLLFRRCCDHLCDLGIGDMYVMVLEKNPACHFYRGMGGVLVVGFKDTLTIAGTAVDEIAFGWTKIPG